MKQNLANRLAAGGIWSLRVAEIAAEITLRLAAEGVQVPYGNGSPADVYVICGVGAFEIVCNWNLDGGDKMAVNVRLGHGEPRLYDKAGQRISIQQWAELQEDVAYKRLALWTDGRVYVSTVWTGVDPNDEEPPHLFETMVVDSAPMPPIIRYMHRAYNPRDAMAAHRVLVLAVQEGRL